MWIVMTSSANMPSSCRGRYRNVAVVQLTQEATARNLLPSRIDARDKRIVRIAHLGHHSVGSTDRCAYAQAVKRAEAMAYERNNRAEVLPTDLMSWGGSA